MDKGVPQGGVGTSTFRTTTGPKFQNIESVFLVDHIYKNQNVKKNIKIQTNKLLTFWFYVKKDQNVKNWKDQLPIEYYLCFPKPVGG